MIGQLFYYGHPVAGALGIGLDLLCGLITVAHFAWLGHGRKCLALVFHPVNFYLHSAYSLYSGQGSEGFSTQVAAYAAAAQSLLEAPVQMIFTLALINIR